MTKAIASIILFFGVLVALICVFGSWGTVEAGHRGVVLRMGAVKGESVPEGFYTKTPWIEDIVEMDIRTQKETVRASAASKDLQVVQAIVALNISVKPDKAAQIYQTIGLDYLSKVVSPSMQESVKSEVSKYTAEELISKRELVREGIVVQVTKKLTPLGINVEALNIENFDFSKAFNEAIENKVTAEQNALAAKNLLAQKEFEAQQAVATAKGKAESMEIEAKAMAENPKILELRAIEKWDGILPKVSSGVTPFIDVSKF